MTDFIAITDDGHQVDVAETDTLLDALEMGGVNWSSSCRNGSCRTCIGQLLEGTVRYEIEWPGLTAEEKAEGYVLPCVARPCSSVKLKSGY